MNIRDAILKAADHIERNPGEYAFMQVRIPSGPDCGTPGCALGWIGTFLGLRGGEYITDAVAPTLGYQPQDSSSFKQLIFYKRMDALCQSTNWRRDPASCAATLRAYANEYFPADSDAAQQPASDAIPESVLALFKEAA